MPPPDATLSLSLLPEPPPQALAPRTLAETVDTLIARGIVLQGEVALAVAGTELVRLDLSAVLRAVVRPVPSGGRDPE
jgi:hypothetical protein